MRRRVAVSVSRWVVKKVVKKVVRKADGWVF